MKNDDDAVLAEFNDVNNLKINIQFGCWIRRVQIYETPQKTRLLRQTSILVGSFFRIPLEESATDYHFTRVFVHSLFKFEARTRVELWLMRAFEGDNRAALTNPLLVCVWPQRWPRALPVPSLPSCGPRCGPAGITPSDPVAAIFSTSQNGRLYPP